MIRRPPRSTRVTYTTLFRSIVGVPEGDRAADLYVRARRRTGAESAVDVERRRGRCAVTPGHLDLVVRRGGGGADHRCARAAVRRTDGHRHVVQEPAWVGYRHVGVGVEGEEERVAGAARAAV